ncbi:probable histone acetyltransferase HAC-like 3 isoform X2 [Phragmites australis]|uniref:probable histone acetyltransferase HAC-like 3 isoform X2 n=1 Tax=Phragmites australis TaxID=29695 RepID=UPI002D78C7C9|nr:probable histone acetyltransferase HAC-like 3 isoform X2 [Phragmites australis]
MMVQTLQGEVLRYAPSSFSIQQQYSQTELDMLQLNNIDQPTSLVRRLITQRIEVYLKEREEFCNFNPDYLLKISRNIDEKLYRDAQTTLHYMDLNTVEVRVNAMLSSISFDSHRDSWLPSATSSTQNLEQLTRIQVPDSTIYHGTVGPGFTNAPSCARDVSTHTVFTSQRYAPNDHNMTAANFALAGRPKTCTNTLVAPCVPAFPKCNSGLGGIVSSGLHNVHIKDHFPGDAHQIDSPQPSMSGSSSPFSAAFDPATSSSTVIRSSMDSISKTNGQKLSTGCNVNSGGQELSFELYREYEKDIDCAWNQPVEQSNQSIVTTESHEMLYFSDNTKKCLYPKGECGVDRYMDMKEKHCHISDCKGLCREKYSNLNTPFSHYQYCFITDCGICDPVSERVERSEQTSNSTVSKPTSPISDESSGKHRPAKRLKADIPNLVHVNQVESPKEQKPVVNETRVSGETVQSENTELPTKSSCCSSLGDNNVDTNKMLEPGSEDVHNMDTVRSPAQTGEELHCANGDIEMKYSETAALDQTPRGVSLNSRKKRGASILYALTAEELRDHMRSLNQHTCPSKVASEEFQLIEGLPDQNTCSLCGKERLLFEPPPRFCGLCFKIINSTGCYYVAVENGTDKTSICSKCHHLRSSKAKYDKRFNYAETDAEAEWWVQCDKCKAWQHQICALFNKKIVDEEAEYTCAKCFLKEKDCGDTYSLESSTVLGAWELPRTKLSDHVERRLSERLEQDRQQRASASGKGVEEVPGVEGLTVRVVSSADRVFQAQARFQEFFKQEKYPCEFPYRSKAILLFQKIDGVDVCLFAMYVQEYGSDCPSPNQRHVYLAYIDSVKYFRPEIKSASGEALRTFVYHEILIGYLDYCKKRGFVSCSIWACPSTKRDDYVLYCHPTAQKMPKSDKLRSWYQNLIKKAVKEGVVVERNTLYDFFLQPTNECKANISAACLPYCENDFWPGEAEKLLEKKDDNTSQKKETQVGRLLRVAKRDDRKGNLEDILLVHRLGERMRTMKDDFIMLCLQQFCKHCHQPIISGKSWVCTSCKNFHLCDNCHAEEQNTAQKDRHPATTKQKHAFQRIEVGPLPETDDGDPTMESKYFDSRIDFLKHCQDNQYQFDTLRRAKHSTMMILYLLHDSICSACHHAMDQCLAWRCLVCLGCKFCDPCYKQSGQSLHIHELRQTDNHKTVQKNTLEDYFEGLVHASRCFDPRNCSSQICVTLKKLFFHGVRCDIRAHSWGGCKKCVFMWKLLLSHSRDCNHVDCLVPRCRDIKLYMTEKKKLAEPML